MPAESNVERIVIGKKRAGMHGFIIFGHVHRFEEAVARLAE